MSPAQTANFMAILGATLRGPVFRRRTAALHPEQPREQRLCWLPLAQPKQPHPYYRRKGAPRIPAPQSGWHLHPAAVWACGCTAVASRPDSGGGPCAFGLMRLSRAGSDSWLVGLRAEEAGSRIRDRLDDQ